MSDSKIIIGSRGSDLALWQANHVKRLLENKGAQVEIKVIKTKGDRIQNLSFDKIEGKGFFTKEIEDALLSKTIDLAVHSLKDLETTSPEGLMIAAVSDRESPNDVLLIKPEAWDDSKKWNLKANAIVATSSARRQAWLKNGREDLQIVDLRGNVPTRIQKLRTQSIDAIVLAEAGINRISPDLSGLEKYVLDVNDFVPAPAQGVLGLQTRSDDATLINMVGSIGSESTRTIVEIERGVLSGVGGGCHVPLGAFCRHGESGFDLIVAHEGEKGFQKVALSGKQDLVEKALSALKKKSFSLDN